jgi:exopolysaccharide biosynthesis predicted pyruvyltransferase EpsI
MVDLRDELRQHIEAVLKPLIQGFDGHICLLDLPNFANVGDNLITLGELAFLEANFPGARLSGFDVTNYSTGCDPLIEQCSVLLIHGGGNFGDIWPRHQRFRQMILERFSHKRIIQLPQSISFSAPEQLAESAAAIAGATDFHLMVRDTASEAFARLHFDCPVYLVPDMAFCILALSRQPPVVDFVCLLRSDKEAVADHWAIETVVEKFSTSHRLVDWNGESSTFIHRLNRGLAKATRFSPRLTWSINGWMVKMRKRYALARMRIGMEMLGSGRRVVTDRLHAHILASLLDIPHFIFNSLDGKVAALYRTWTYRYEKAVLIEDAEALRNALQDARR